MGDVHNRVDNAHTVVQAGRIESVTITAPGPAPARSRYREQVREIAPARLVGREPELARLAGFATGEDRYLWVRAPKWAGKSALLSWFVLHPPVGVRVVSFFITARLADSDHRGAFVDVVLEQLADLLDQPLPPYLTDATRESHLRGLLGDAAALCRSRGEHLLLVVDGLDEDRGTGSSIAGLLPARPPEGLRVLVSGRPNPPIPAEVHPGHPLRDPAIRMPLDTSPAALVIRDDMELELARLLDGPPEVQDLLGLVTAAAGGLSAADLAELTDATAAEVRRTLRRTATRTFDVRPSRWQAGVRPEVYLLGHEELQLAATDHIGRTRLQAYHERLHTWAESYRDRGWPEDTPEYLLRGYFRMVAAHGGPLLELCTDARRHDRMADVSGGDTPALTEIALAETRLSERGALDLPTAARLAVHRDRLLSRGGHLPTTLLTVWALLGHTSRAEVVVGAFRGADRRAAAEIALVAAVADAGDRDRAAAIAATVVAPEARAAALSRLAAAHARAGEIDRARELIAQAAEVIPLLTENGKVRIAASAQIDALVAVGDTEAARAVPDRLTGPSRDDLLLDLVRALGPGHAAEAERIADDGVRAEALAAIAVDRAGLKAALRALRGVRGEFERAARRIALIPAAVAAGEPEKARSLARSADPGWLAQGLAALAGALRGTEQAPGLRREAEAAARAIPAPYWRANALIDVAVVEAEAGQVERARAIVDSVGLPSQPRMIDDVLLPERRVRGLAQVAAALARAGQAEEALRTAAAAEAAARGLVEEPRLGGLVSALAAAHDFDRACAVVGAVDCEHAVVEGLVRALASSGRLGQAEGLAHAGLDGRVRSEIVRGWVVAGDLDEADAAVTRLFRRDLAPGQARLARDLATAGHHDRALTTAERIGADDVRAEAVAVVACALRRHGHHDRAASLADRAERWALALPGGAGVGVVRVFADHRDFDRAERLARALPHSALQDDEPVDLWEDEVRPRLLALGYLRTRLRAAGLTERAERIAAEVGPDLPRADPRNGLFAIPVPPRPVRVPGSEEVRTALAEGLWRDVVSGLPADALAALADEVLALPR